MTNEVLLTMSEKEINTLEIIQKVVDKRLTQVKAAEILKVTPRHIRRLRDDYLAQGAGGLLSKRRGQPSNRRHSLEFKDHVMELVKEHYHDFGPTLASEKLAERDTVIINRESLRQWMIEAGLWKGKRRKQIKVYERRLRRPCFGELVQIDGSPHDWFEGRGERCCLIIFIDDATNVIIAARFFPAETTNAYFHVAKLHLQRYGKPLAYYSDKHGIFRVNIKGALTGTGMSQFERAMHELEIELINANSPQAKGRIEKTNATMQDRLVKEMRLRNISNIDAANAFIDEFMDEYNRRFALEPRAPENVHRSPPDSQTLGLILCWQEERVLSKTLTMQFEKQLYQINVPGEGYTLRQARVTVCKDENENITILYKNRPLNYSVFDKQMQHSEIKTAKEIETCKLKPRRKYIPPKDHPWKQSKVKKSRKASSSAVEAIT